MGANGGGTPRAGFVLAGGKSSRMGCDKALLPFATSTLVDHIAGCVLQAAGSVTLIGPPERYRALEIPVVADLVPGCGPLGGVFTALSITNATWNLIVACDMPGLEVEFLQTLFRAAENSGADCVVPEDSAGLHPLCAVYHVRCREAAAAAIEAKSLKMHDFISSLRDEKIRATLPSVLENINTPEQWSAR
ncbi:MAG: molybdenum cofactor guanylyltransferase [Bryobacteraceae bacterium]